MYKNKYNGKIAILYPEEGGFGECFQPVLTESGWYFIGRCPFFGGTLMLTEKTVLSGKTQWGEIKLVSVKDLERESKKAHKRKEAKKREREKTMEKVANILKKEKTILGVEKVRKVLVEARQRELNKLRAIRKEVQNES